MQNRYLLAIVKLIVVFGCLLQCALAAAVDPVQRKNLAVYLIRGHAAVAPASMLTIDQALKQNLARIYVRDKGPLTIDNSSNQTIFVHSGTLLRGGTQDQVVQGDVVVPPHVEGLEISTYCIDPFRNGAREGESETTYVTDGSLFPWRLARLNLIAWPDTARDTIVRRAAIWWSIDSLRSALSEQLGQPLEPAHTPAWQISDQSSALAARRTPWTSGLVLALENPKLASALAPYLVSVPRVENEEFIGAAFAINGQIQGVELYQTHQLFLALWPHLLRAYSVEAIALGEVRHAKPLTAKDIDRFIAAKSQADASLHGFSLEPGFGVFESGSVVTARMIDANGSQIHRSLLPLPDPHVATMAPEMLTLQMLRTERVEGLALAGLGKHDDIRLAHDAGGYRWHAEVLRDPEPDSVVTFRSADLLQRWLDANPPALLAGHDAATHEDLENVEQADDNTHGGITPLAAEPPRTVPLVETRERTPDVLPVVKTALDRGLNPAAAFIALLLMLLQLAWSSVKTRFGRTCNVRIY